MIYSGDSGDWRPDARVDHGALFIREAHGAYGFVINDRWDFEAAECGPALNVFDRQQEDVLTVERVKKATLVYVGAAVASEYEGACRRPQDRAQRH